jgi:hypothetical protein
MQCVEWVIKLLIVLFHLLLFGIVAHIFASRRSSSRMHMSELPSSFMPVTTVAPELVARLDIDEVQGVRVEEQRA